MKAWLLFSGLTLDTAGTGYILQLSSGNLEGVASDGAFRSIRGRQPAP